MDSALSTVSISCSKIILVKGTTMVSDAPLIAAKSIPKNMASKKNLR
jgi:hypothetical protein